MQIALTDSRRGVADVSKALFRNDVFCYGQKDTVAQTKKGRVGFNGLFNTWYDCFPNLTYRSVSVHQTASNQFISRWKVIGNHDGIFDNIKPTGKLVGYRGYNIVRLDQYGKVSMYGFDIDVADLMNQLSGSRLLSNQLEEQDRFRKARLIDYLRQLGTQSALLTKVSVAFSAGGIFSQNQSDLSPSAAVVVRVVCLFDNR